MKKIYLLAGLISFGMLLVGCDREGKGGGDLELNPGFDGEMAEITPAKSKSRLQDIGVEFVNAINAETHENLVEMLAYVESNLDFEVDEAYYEKLYGLVEVSGNEDEDYARSINPVRAMADMAGLCLDVAQSGPQLASRAADIYMFTLKAGLKDIYGGFAPDMSNEEWRYDSSVNDRLEVKFTDEHDRIWVATLKGSKETARVNLTYDDIYECNEVYEYGDKETYEEGYHDRYVFSVDVPKVITFVVKSGNEEIINLEVNSSLALKVEYSDDCKYDGYSGYDDNGDWYYSYTRDYKTKLEVDYSNLNLDAVLNVNGYAESWVVKVSKSNIQSSAEVKIGGQSMLKAEAVVNGDMDAFVKAYNEYCTFSYSYSSKEGEGEYVDSEFDPTCLKDFAMKLDVMGKAQVYGKCDSFEKFYNAYHLTDEEWEEIYGSVESYDIKAWEKYIDAINDTYEITVHYDNTATVQANVELEVVEFVEEDEYEEYTYYSIRPVLVFAADDSRYAFEDYFTESGFRKVFDAVEDLAEELEDMFGQYAEEEEYYPY